MILYKLEFSFVSNFTFIGHLLQSIEDAKKIESEQQQEKGSELTIAIDDNPEIRSQNLLNLQKQKYHLTSWRYNSRQS